MLKTYKIYEEILDLHSATVATGAAPLDVLEE